MGTWGIGNFDNDEAADYVNDLVDRLTAMVTVILTDKTRAALDEEGEAVVMPIVGILTLLCEQCGADPPDEGAIVRWRDNYLQIFDNQIDDLAPRGNFKAERRTIIAQTFERLLGCSQVAKPTSE